MKLPDILDPTPECTIVSTRIFKYPLELVFKAWSDPDYLQQWWGPKDFTNTFHEFDLRPGGRWRFTMHGPVGKYLNDCLFITIVPSQKLIWHRLSKPLFQVNTSFDDVDGGTKVTFRMVFDSARSKGKIQPLVDSGKNEENFDRLETVLSQMKLLV